ncbi:Lipid phosphate phosphatase epsilon 2, chloroplastic [Sesamum alatum]|uniref:Lipid phosphate phosphatase epsilon 2, chloroplastic n=1 Tax=Sesamum alatum TaxID=300844 RepID=A0AAE1XST7_9LAMI|nr:Lipid phosphate phosphatase epsilon 2, chloroplastic [Sesamum alatum]
MSAIFESPLAAASFTVSQSRKPQKPIKICAKRLGFGGVFGCRKSVSWATLREKQSIMTVSIGVRIRDDERIKAFEQEAPAEESTNLGAGGLEATLNALSKWFFSALSAAIILWRHDAGALWAATGVVFNIVLSITLKKILNQERPISTLRSDPGMPSSHAHHGYGFLNNFIHLARSSWDLFSDPFSPFSGHGYGVASY